MFVVIWDCPRAHKSGQLRALTITPTIAPRKIRYGHSFYGWVLKNGLYDTTIAAPAISSKILCNLSLQHSATFKYIWPQAKCRKRISKRDARFKAQNSKLQIFCHHRPVHIYDTELSTNCPETFVPNNTLR